ncbi:hypothetical protein M9H77_08302 [Catharanthus roseus]|uniref:Uncharacterized protein n=1 Tax=Catharanthus roseus TaxID=4058 RepID=A0ACC0BXL7_CATRO|nr:hypothetical protein M9H77_08302 [Catharanthus roseus]
MYIFTFTGNQQCCYMYAIQWNELPSFVFSRVVKPPKVPRSDLFPINADSGKRRRETDRSGSGESLHLANRTRAAVLLPLKGGTKQCEADVTGIMCNVRFLENPKVHQEVEGFLKSTSLGGSSSSVSSDKKLTESSMQQSYVTIADHQGSSTTLNEIKDGSKKNNEVPTADILLQPCGIEQRDKLATVGEDCGTTCSKFLQDEGLEKLSITILLSVVFSFYNMFMLAFRSFLICLKDCLCDSCSLCAEEIQISTLVIHE